MDVTKILILAANPKDTTPLDLDQEVREIEEALRRAPNGRANFEVIKEQAVTLKALRQALLEHEPQIVHFAGHGAGADGLVLEDEEGSSQQAETKGIARLLGLFPTIECVVLNACYSEVQAEALLDSVSGCLIGMQRAVGDDAARKFAQGFYDGIGYGRSFEDAFQLGLSELDSRRLPHEPVLNWGRRQGPPMREIGGAASGTTRGPGEESTEATTPPAAVKRDISWEPEEAAATPQRQPAQKLFISYKRSAEPDEALAMALVAALGQGHEVFIDQQMTVGTRWKEEISERIRRADAIVVLLSEASVHSEMVALEVSLAQEAAAANGGRPMILPVRVDYREPFEYPLSVYLDEINWAFWQGPQDTSGLIGELQAALRGGALAVDSEAAKAELVERKPVPDLPRPRPSAQPQGRKQKQAAAALALEQPEGTMDPESAFYVARDQIDNVALETIAQPGVTVTIKGPRQMGKSSLLLRTMAAAGAAGKEVVFLDFQLFDQAALQDADTFYRQFCYCLTDELDLEDEVDKYWARPLGNTQRCTRYVGRHILKQVEQPIVLAMDEVERMFDTPFRNDFFSMLRSWHNQRAMKPLWKRLDLALVTSTEPYQLIADLNQSPFNVGQVLRLEDFSPEQVGALNEAHGEPFGVGELQKLIGLLNGHPYLTRRALYLVASGRLGAAELFTTAADEHGPFGDHLRYHLFRMYDQRSLVDGFMEVLRRRDCADERVFFRLNGAGIVMRVGNQVVPRCQLYAEFFGEHLKNS